MRVLVIAAHPDDEVLGCGGTMSRLSKEGHEIYISILGEGITSRYENPSQTDLSELETLKNCSKKASELLGATDLFFHNFPDNSFDTVPLLKIVKTIQKLICRLQPEVVYTQHGGDLNIDHQITFRATLTATRPMEGFLKTLYAYEVPSSTEWAFQKFAPPFKANTFVDIHSTLELKIKAMELYESEARPFPHPRSPEALRAIAKKWGTVIGLKAAEAFELIWSKL